MRRRKTIETKFIFTKGRQKKITITKSRIVPRKYELDAVYNSSLVTQLINRVMKEGKKELARRIVYNALSIVKYKTKESPLNVLEKAINNIKPELETRSRRIGGQNYQIPIDVTKRRKLSLAIRWLVLSARQRKDENMTKRLANEIIDASNLTGGAVKRKDDMQKLAIANRAFSHYRW